MIQMHIFKDFFVLCFSETEVFRWKYVAFKLIACSAVVDVACVTTDLHFDKVNVVKWWGLCTLQSNIALLL